MKTPESILQLLPRNSFTLPFSDALTADRLLDVFQSVDPFVFLNSNRTEQLQEDKYEEHEVLLAAGSIESVSNNANPFQDLQKLHAKKDWVFGFLTYDVKNRVEQLTSGNYDGIGFPEYYFFIPRYVISKTNNKYVVHYHPEYDTEESIKSLFDIDSNFTRENNIRNKLRLQSRINKEDYLRAVNKLQEHIHRGDVYEINYCIEFYSEQAFINPSIVYRNLNTLSPMPFSAFLRLNDHYLICASPERFLAKRGNKIISQPIKGTMRRGNTEAEDIETKTRLKNDPKEQAENVMIVDLVRNDLSRTAAKGSVQVEELFGVKTFRHLHQLESTVTAELKEDLPLTEVIRNAFPMGSMTGAPKVKAMELIEKYELTKRGLYSGTIGYLTPGGDFDFNVVIRSILYNAKKKYLSFMVGSAITHTADAGKEYEECLLKAEATRRVLEQD